MRDHQKLSDHTITRAECLVYDVSHESLVKLCEKLMPFIYKSRSVQCFFINHTENQECTPTVEAGQNLKSNV